MARSLNRVQLIGNLTRDPELRYTPQGTAVCSFGLATNRTWNTEQGEKKEESEFHKIVAWNKLAELCSQFLQKGRKVYVEGRLATRSWTGQDGGQRNATEIVIDDMILLDYQKRESSDESAESTPSGQSPLGGAVSDEEKTAEASKEKPEPKAEKPTSAKPMTETSSSEEAVMPDDIPF